MKRTLLVFLAIGVLLAVVTVAVAQDQEYSLKDYMPQTVGSKWIMKTTNQQGDTTNVVEVAEPKEIAAQQATQFLTKDAGGNLQRGSLEAITDNAYYLFGTIRVPRGGGEPVTTLYTPMVVFPAKLKVGQEVSATTKVMMRDAPAEVVIKLQLAAVENVTVPKGTFNDCLKLVLAAGFGDRQMKTTLWYAKGVGMIKSERPGFGQNQTPRVSALIEYALVEAK